MMWIARYKDLKNHNNNGDDKLKMLKIKFVINKFWLKDYLYKKSKDLKVLKKIWTYCL
jgi:hypothetical protein